MINLLIFALWVTTGVGLAAVLGDTPGRFAWAPFAAVVGPLWLFVATEQRSDLAVATEPIGEVR
jgi:hypothetical protein